MHDARPIDHLWVQTGAKSLPWHPAVILTNQAADMQKLKILCVMVINQILKQIKSIFFNALHAKLADIACYGFK